QESIAQRTQSRVFVIRSMRQHADMVDAEIKRLTKLKKHYEQRADALEESTLALLQSTGIHTIEGDLMVVKIRSNPPAVDVFDPAQVPTEYLRTPEPPPPAPDKTAIKDALKRGIDIPGARLIQTQRLAVA
ncbi:MAG: siphovirus Gp157 family protein, partial [Macromonas sp.]